MCNAVQEARIAGRSSRINPLVTISAIHRLPWQFEMLIADINDESESAKDVDISEDVEVRRLWAISYLKVKVRTLPEILPSKYCLKRLFNSKFRRQAQTYSLVDERLQEADSTAYFITQTGTQAGWNIHAH